MTAREKVALEYPSLIDPSMLGGVEGCPTNRFDNLYVPDYCPYRPSFGPNTPNDEACRRCWDREIPEEPGLIIGDEKIEHPDTDISEETTVHELEKQFKEGTEEDVWNLLGVDTPRKPTIDIGRCDLLPMCVVEDLMIGPASKSIFYWIDIFTDDGNYQDLYPVLREFAEVYMIPPDKDVNSPHKSVCHMLLEVSKQIENDDWKDGIRVDMLIKSAVDHYLKLLRGDKDEHHDTAFCWDIIRAIWTCRMKPELNPYGKEDTDE